MASLRLYILFTITDVLTAIREPLLMLKPAIILCLNLTLLACSSGGIPTDVTGEDKKELGAAFAAGALGTDQPDRANFQLLPDTTYSWSVRVENELGVGFWSHETEFTVFDTEAKALADAVSKDDSFDFSDEMYKDDIPISTVVPVSPAGSITVKTPNFTWLPTAEAGSYRFRLINTSTNEVVVEESVPASAICTSNSCAVYVGSGKDSDASENSITTVSTDNSAIAQALSPQPTVNSTNTETTPEPETTPAPASPSITEPEIPSINNEEDSESEQDSGSEQTGGDEQNSTTDSNNSEEPTPTTESSTTSETTDPQPNTDTGTTDPGPTVQEENTLPELSEAQELMAKIELQQQQEGLLAFPGAIGFAKNSAGGRGGKVVVVNTVLDVVDSSDGLTSLREALEVETGARTIVFEVGGIFNINNLGLTLSGENGSYVTVACHTAPSPGVVIKTYGFNIQDSAHDIIFRHCRVRGVDVGYPGSTSSRSFTIRGGTRNLMLDHMSLSWFTDEGFQVYLDSSQQVGIENVTLSNSIVAEGDADSSHALSASHPNWGYHAMGPSCNNNNGSFRPTNCSIVNNFIAHNSSRNAMIWGGAGELANNIVYNWYGVGVTARPQSGSDVDVIVRNNLMKSGPDTEGGTSNPDCGIADYRCALFLGETTSEGVARYSVGDNYYISEYENLEDAVLMSRHINADTPAGIPAFDPMTEIDQSILDMAVESSSHMNCLGASKPSRDQIDARVIQEFHDGTGAIGIGDNVKNGAHNSTLQRTFDVYGAPTSHPIGYDLDKDGMADSWELMMGFDSNNSNDHSLDADGDGYTNIEEFLAYLADCQ